MTSAIGFRSERGPILIALMLTMGVVAVEATVLATAVPTIVGDLGDFALFPWLFSVYLLAQAVTVPIYAKLSDIFGRKPIILVGIGLFLAGSILCGFAWNMPALIVFRALQGLGAGAVMPMTITIAGDIYTIAERAKAQGYLAAVWGISSVVGPTLGGVFSQLEIWRGIFFINVPLCLLAAWMLIRSFKEEVHKRDHRIDYAGAALLTVSMSLLILGVLQGGVSWAWDSWQSIGSFTVGGLLLATFVLVQTRAAEPVLPLWVFSRRLLLTTTLISLGVGAILIGLTSYVPVYLEGSIGVPPLAAGLALAALTIGWPISGAFAGRFYLRIGFKSTALLGLAVALVGATVLAVTASSPSVALVATACFVIGLGLGVVATPTLIAAQASVEWGDRGVVTGTNQFARAIGSAVGAAVFGAIANAAFGSGADVPAAAIISGGSAVFVAVAVVGVATLGAVVAMPATPVPGRP